MAAPPVDNEYVEEFPDEFRRIVFMATEINRSRHAKSFLWEHPKLFLSGYFDGITHLPRLRKCFRDLPPARRPPSPHPSDRVELLYTQPSEDAENNLVEPGTSTSTSDQVDSEGNQEMAVSDQEGSGSGSGSDEDDPELTTVQLRSFLMLLREIRIALDEKAIDPAARYDVLRLFLCTVGVRFDMISRLLYYMYPPAGVFNLEVLVDPPVDPKERYPTEYMILSLMYDTKKLMSPREYTRYVTLWKNVKKLLYEGNFGVEESREALERFTEILSPYEELSGRLSEIPWPHLTQPPAASETPSPSEEMEQ